VAPAPAPVSRVDSVPQCLPASALNGGMDAVSLGVHSRSSSDRHRTGSMPSLKAGAVFSIQRWSECMQSRSNGTWFSVGGAGCTRGDPLLRCDARFVTDAGRERRRARPTARCPRGFSA